ncbi:MAG: polysaccharide biosynthesis tyrosine autokinase [Pseudomonadota bacterium]
MHQFNDAGQASAAEGVDIRQVLGAIWRGRWLIAVLSGLMAIAAVLVVTRLPPVYEAASKVLLDTRDRRVANVENVVGALDVDNAAVASEIALIRSEDVLGTTIDRFALDKIPEFGAPRQSIKTRAIEWVAGQLPQLQPYLPVTRQPDMSPEAARQRARNRLRAPLITSQEGRSFVIRIAVQAGTPDLAAAVANGIAGIYVERQLSTKSNATTRASSILSTRLASLKAEVEQADAAVEQRKQQQADGDGQSVLVTDQQLGDINRELVSARAARAEAEARYGQIEQLIAARGRGAAADILSSPLILTLRQQRAEVKRQEAELSTRYGPKHPRMANVRAELKDLFGAIASEVSKLVAGLQNDVEVALARERTLADALAELEARSADQSRAAVGLRQLEREADASRRIYESFLSRWKETTETASLQEPDARIISEALPPDQALGPKAEMISGLAGVAGLFGGLTLVFLGELMCNTFRTGAEAERLLGLPLLGRLPRLKRASKRRVVLAHLARSPNSAFAEAARGLRNALVLSSPDQVPRSVMVTSAVPGEGKTATCVALANMSALAGKRAVIVDCDLRRPQLGSAIDKAPASPLGAGPDLIDVLQGAASIEEALRPFGPDGCAALPILRPSPESADLLSDAAFVDLMAELSTRFDLVLLDTPPALAVADAVVVGRAAEACLFLLRWNATPRQAVQECLRRLAAHGISPTGFAMSLVDPRREAAYEYGAHRKGAPDYSSYYAAAR